MRTLTATALLLLLAGCEPAPDPAAESAPDEPSAEVEHRDPLGCVLSGEPACVLGQAPRLRVALVNRSNAEIVLVGSLDHSHSKRRYPHCGFQVAGPPGWAPAQLMMCKQQNPLRAADFVAVPAGASFDPYQTVDEGGFFGAPNLGAADFATPGEYRVRFRYSSKCDDLAKWLGNGGPNAAPADKLAALFARVPRVKVESNEFVVTVAKPAK